ncbi:hypothetical protein [Rossellomorea sp. DA94]|uniref:hypothetical protein n=1 Tax=Rossellomorea sp. DA94 TaxID=3038653 RepID=UPI002446EFD5|nr:hypothetical protein [Rossellomorea sp. DA94]WGG47672.1 hypothetical protein P8596_10880 [Rossellomorea sp. DA94]
MFYKPERIIQYTETGVFALDIWISDGVTNVHCEQVDTKSSYKAFISNDSRNIAISQAVKFVVEENRKSNI